MPAIQPPVVVVPGITASQLRDEYPVDPEPVWGILSKAWERVHLHPDDVRYELEQPARVTADRIFGFPYGDFIEDLRYDLAPARDRPVPVYPFAYDWRMPLDEVERQLEAFVEEVAARTALLRHYHEKGYRADTGKVDLVGHSMGGLLIAGYVERSGGARVRKAATLGTPFKGSFEAVLKMTTGLSTLGDSNSRERAVARLTPALYHLLPRYQDAVSAEEGLGKDLFRANTWQPSVIGTIAEQIRTHGLGVEEDAKREDLLPRARERFQALLDRASEHRVRVSGFSLASVGMTRNDWLAVVGIGERTRVHLHIVEKGGEPFFDLRSADRRNGWPAGEGETEGAAPVETGDGTVPYQAAVPPFLGAENLVCLADDDFGYWELRDRLMERGVGDKNVGLHSMLPAMNVVEKLVVCHLKGEAGEPGTTHGGVWGRTSPELDDGDDWRPPLRGLRQR